MPRCTLRPGFHEPSPHPQEDPVTPSLLTPTRAALAAFTLAVVASASPALAQRDFDWNGELAPGTTLRVFTTHGTVTVREASGRSARIHADVENAERDEIRRWGRNQRGKANFTVEVPRGVVVRVSSGNGDVAVGGATADVHASS